MDISDFLQDNLRLIGLVVISAILGGAIGLSLREQIPISFGRSDQPIVNAICGSVVGIIIVLVAVAFKSALRTFTG
jgi:hypothetical protein